MAFEVRNGEVAPSELSCASCPFFTGNTPIKGLKRSQCRFDQKRFGGFKGTRPHYIAYRIITDKVEQHSAKEDIMLCQNFVRNMQDRMDFGAARRVAGFDGEIIKIIAQEGEPITLRTRVGINVNGHIVKPNAELKPKLEASGFTIAPDNAVVVEWKDVSYKTTVPSYVEELERITGYSESILKREFSEQGAMDEVEDAAWQAAQRKMSEDADSLPVPPGGAFAEPIKRGPGRPPKEANEPA